MKLLSTFKERFQVFFNGSISPVHLGIFRLLISGFTIFQAIFWYPDWKLFFGKEGWVQWEISKAFTKSWSLHIEDIYVPFEKIGINENLFINLFWAIYIISACGLFIGWFTRLWAILTWVCHYILMSSLPNFVYGVDIFLHLSLFYLMVMPVAKAGSIDLFLGRVNSKPTWSSTLAIRVLQIHLCLAYFSAGYEKMLYANWWEGDVLWRALVQPDFRQFDFHWIVDYPWIVIILSVFTMFIETFYFVGMWIPKLRVFWLISMIGLHIGIGIFIGLYLFGLIMISLSISAFGYDAWKDVLAWYSNKKTPTHKDHYVQSVSAEYPVY